MAAQEASVRTKLASKKDSHLAKHEAIPGVRNPLHKALRGVHYCVAWVPTHLL